MIINSSSSELTLQVHSNNAAGIWPPALYKHSSGPEQAPCAVSLGAASRALHDSFAGRAASDQDYDQEADFAKVPNLPATATASRSLIEALCAGNELAWGQFVDEWSPRLYAYLRYSLPTREDAEDALSETMVAAVTAIRNFDGKSQLSTWLYAIARRKVVDFWRKNNLNTTEELSDLFAETPSGFSIEFREALAALPEVTRQALLLRYREGFSVGEVADILHRTYKATESLLSRGRALLAAQLRADS